MKTKRKLLVVGDLHGRHEILENAYDEFLLNNYDKLILIGDYADSFDRSNEDILKCFKLCILYKEQFRDDFIALIGNHDLQYKLEDNKGNTCSGYRPNLFTTLNYIFRMHKNVFQYAYSLDNYLFTHAGISNNWFLKHEDIFDKYCDGLDTTDEEFVGKVINRIGETHDAHILHENGYARNGNFDYGGPLWCDKLELCNNPLKGVDQVCGHTPVPFIMKKTIFNNKKVDNTSITFIDVLNTKQQFLKLDI